MKIYFSCAITGGRDFEPVYQAITAALLSAGHTVPTAHLADSGVKTLEGRLSPRQVYERDIAWIKECDALVAEVSTPSHGVGYEVAYALSLGKPVLCLYQEGRSITKMLSGNTNPTIQVSQYSNIVQAISIIYSFMEQKP